MLVTAVEMEWGTMLTWMKHASCHGTPTNTFYPPKLGIYDRDYDTRRALATCEQCEVVDQCRQYAIDNDESGIWGGTTEGQRRHMKNGTQPKRRGPKPQIITGMDAQ